MKNTAVRALLATGAAWAAVGGAPAGASTEPPDTPADEVPDAAAGEPVEFTACVRQGAQVNTGGTDETTRVVPGGDMTVRRGRGYMELLVVSDVSDPRLDGTWHHSFDYDWYSPPGPLIGVETDRIENEGGVWQGSRVDITFADDTWEAAPYVMTGGNEYAGLTAIYIANLDPAHPCPTVRGYIIEGSIPGPPVPSDPRQ
jgi:hypothetical protein